VFYSAFFRSLRSGGPPRVAAMTKRFNVFAFSTRVFFLARVGTGGLEVCPVRPV